MLRLSKEKLVLSDKSDKGDSENWMFEVILSFIVSMVVHIDNGKQVKLYVLAQRFEGQLWHATFSFSHRYFTDLHFPVQLQNLCSLIFTMMMLLVMFRLEFKFRWYIVSGGMVDFEKPKN